MIIFCSNIEFSRREGIVENFKKLPPFWNQKIDHRPEVGELEAHRGLKMFVKVIHWGFPISPRPCLETIFEISASQDKILVKIFLSPNSKIFTLWSQYLKNRHQTPPRAEPRPPIDWFCAYFEPFITS